MLNGVAPIIIFNFKKTIDLTSPLSKIPVLSSVLPQVPVSTIPLYLDEGLTGIYIDSQSKNIDVTTDVMNTAPTAKDPNPVIKQNPINNIVTLNMLARDNSIGMLLLSLFCDQMFTKLVQEEYSIDYINSTTVLFGALLHGFSTVQNSNNTLFNISLQLSTGRVNSTVQGVVAKIAQPFFGSVPPAAPAAASAGVVSA